MDFDVFHSSTVYADEEQLFTVNVKDDNSGSDIENAYVCLWKGDEVYLTDYTDSSGNITFNPFFF